MKRNHLISAGLISLIAGGCNTTGEEPFGKCKDDSDAKSNPKSLKIPKKPNIIILFADDMGYGDLSCYGHPTIHTPNLDRMANEGMKMTQFNSTASVSTPSRAALLTGRYPVRSGMASEFRAVLFPDNEGGIPQEEILLSEALKEQGYATACVGKWHLGHLEQYLPLQNGFDYYFGIPYSNDMSGETHPDPSFDKYPPLPLMEGNETIEEEPDQSLLTKRYTEKALSFIEENKEGPFFLYLPYTMPHTPVFASEEFKGKSRRGLYGDVIAELDHSVGEILKKLEELGIDENTLVFFTSDNGPWLRQDLQGGSKAMFRGSKATIFEGGFRVPAIAWWPGIIKPASLSKSLSCTMDMYTTAVQLAGGELPTDRVVDGVDMMPILLDPEAEIRETFYYYHFEHVYAMRYGPYKVFIQYEYEEGKKPEPGVSPWFVEGVYNVETDLSESFGVENEWVERMYPDVAEKASEKLRQHNSTITRGENMMIKGLDINPADHY